MGLSSALEIGRSGLLAQQTAIEVAGNNLANVATNGYHRQRTELTPISSGSIGGASSGRGVQLSQIVRQIDLALEGRLRNGASDQAASQTTEEVLIQVESLYNELTDYDVSSHLSAFFNAWSELANTPDDLSQRNLVVQEGNRIAATAQDLRDGLVSLRDQLDQQIVQSVDRANDLLGKIQALNTEIVVSEQGQQNAHHLRDQRDLLVTELSSLVDVSVNEHPTGAVDVFVGSLPIILNGASRGLEATEHYVDGELKMSLRIADDGSILKANSGKLGALVDAREGQVSDAITQVDDYFNNLIFEINRAHSQGQGLGGVADVVGSLQVVDADVALNDAAAKIPFDITHGSFQLHVTSKSAGQRTSSVIKVDLDGIDPDNDTTLTSLAAAINNVENVSAEVRPDGRLHISSDSSDLELSFSNDSSGALAALGVNTFFTGGNAQDIAVNTIVANDLNRLAASKNHVRGDNSNALGIAEMRDRPLASLGGISLSSGWDRQVEEFASRLAGARSQSQADQVVLDSLFAQQQQVSGVSADEEAINLLAYQRAYQGSARFLSVVDELMTTLIQLL